MDNITHSVIGLVAGDGVHQATNRHELQSIERRKLFLLSSVLGNNIPDIDIIYKWLYPHPVGTLLHHRGYTHTLAWAIPEALLVVGILLLFRGGLLSKRLTFRDWSLGFITALLGVLLHIFADSWNSYGVHPFYPINNSWFFGDYIFIIEPLLWSFCAAWIAVEMSMLWRILIFSIFSLIIGFGFSIQAISIQQVLGLFVVISAATLLLAFLPSRLRSLSTLVFLGLTLFIFNSNGAKARDYVLRVFDSQKVEDVALSPMPLNPYCWIALVATIEKDEFVVRRASVSLWPERIAASACRFVELDTKPVAAFVSDASLEWNQEYKTRLNLFSSYSSDCYFKHWMRFARMPFISNGVAQDLRFANRRRINFSDLLLKPGRDCIDNVPPWIPPRSNLLGEAH